MTQYYSFIEGAGFARLGEEPQASEWSHEGYLLKVESGDLYEMDEDGVWELIK